MFIVDTSYVVFYRLYALKMWMSKAKPEVDLEVEDITTVPEFMEKYESTFFTTLQKIMKRRGASVADVIFVLDCRQEDIWRKKIFPQYKANRDYSGFNGGNLFQWTYDKLLPQWEAEGARVLKFDHLEADDIAAYLVRHVRDVLDSERPITIVTNDNDYLQLGVYPEISLINLKEDDIEKRSMGNPTWDLEKKVILGDPSDNIPKIFKKCGPKTLLKYLNDRDELARAFEREPDAVERYKLNRSLIDFAMIPSVFLERVREWCGENLKC